MKFIRTVPGLLLATTALVAVATALYIQAGDRVRAGVRTEGPAPVKAAAVEPGGPTRRNAREGKVEVDPTRTFTHYRVGNNSVIAIYADGSVLWLGTSGGIVRYDTLTHAFKTYDARQGLLSNGILYLGKLQGKISVGTYGGGLSLLDQDTQEWEHFGVSHGLGDAYVYDVLESSSADVWIATGAGVSRIRAGAMRERAKWDHYTVKSTGGGLPNDRVYRIVEGKDGSVWFATRGGVANFRNGKWKNWMDAEGLGARREGAKPGLASDAGAARVQARDAEHAQEAQGASARAVFERNHIAALEVGDDGRVWAGTRNAGLARFDGKAWRNYTVADGLPSNQITALNFDGNGRLWIGTSDGLAVLDKGKFQVMTAAHGLMAEKVYSVLTTQDGGVWVGSFGGVTHMRRPASRQYIPPPASINTSTSAPQSS